MKQFVAIFLLLVLLAPVAGTYTWLQYHKSLVHKQVKRELKKHIPEEELVVFRFSKSEIKSKLNWKHSKEFEFKGQMYDVISVCQSEDSVTYKCWWDNEETKINKQLAHLATVAFQNDSSRNEHQKILLFYFNFPFIHFQNNNLQGYLSASTIKLKVFLDFSLQPFQIENNSPPPQFS